MLGVVCAVAVLTLTLIGSAQLANADMQLTWQEAVFSLNQQYVEKNHKLKEIVK